MLLCWKLASGGHSPDLRAYNKVGTSVGTFADMAERRRAGFRNECVPSLSCDIADLGRCTVMSCNMRTNRNPINKSQEVDERGYYCGNMPSPGPELNTCSVYPVREGTGDKWH